MHTVLQARKIFNQNIKKNQDKILPLLTLLGLKCCLFILLVTSVWNRNKSELSQCIQASLYDSAQQNNCFTQSKVCRHRNKTNTNWWRLFLCLFIISFKIYVHRPVPCLGLNLKNVFILRKSFWNIILAKVMDLWLLRWLTLPALSFISSTKRRPHWVWQ